MDPIRPGSVHTTNTASCLCVLIAKVRSGERERLLEEWAAGKVQGDTSSDWILNAVRQKNYQQGRRDMLAQCVAVLDAHHPGCTEPCDLCAEWSVVREELEALAGNP
jgi:hypothetical protein